MRVIVLLLALASAFTFAADNAVVAPQSAVNPQSAIDNRQSTIVRGAEAITIPQMLSYQGKLTDTLGQPVPNGNYQLTFRLYTQPTSGSAFWSEPQTIMVKSGLFSALLGAVTPITSLPDAGALYLSLQVAADPELSPRLRIASAAYAYLTERASNADLLQGKDTAALDSRYVNEGQASSVTSNMMVDGTIVAVDLGQMGASSGQVMKWTGSAWAPRNDSVGSGGGGTVTSVSQATGVVCSPNPITTTGTVGFDQTYGDGRYVNVSGDSMTARLAVAGEVRSHVRGTFGANCTNQGTSSFAAGQLCKAYADFCNVGGGYFNQAGEPSSYDSCATVCGGYYNFNGGRFTFIGGGRKNGCSYDRGVICGGDSNGVNGSGGAICGGMRNRAFQYSVVGGGVDNSASGSYSVVCGGASDSAIGYYSSVGGGDDNAASGTNSTVSGGYYNVASGVDAVVGGGFSNTASDSEATVGGGAENWAIGKSNTVGGGYQNVASDNFSTVAGGRLNTASGTQATVGGGYADTASAANAVVAGGQHNAATGSEATVSGGNHNSAGGTCSAVTGGYYGSVSGNYSTVIGSAYDTCAANYALVAGSSVRARSGAQYTFAFGEGCSTSTPRAVVFYHSGAATKLGVGVQNPTHYVDVTGGSYCDASGWHNGSSRALKKDIAAMTPEEMRELAAQLEELEVVRFRYKLQDDDKLHVGVIAEDAPDVLVSARHDALSTGDAIGFLLAVAKAQQAEIEQLKAELTKSGR
jgi:hypothetical protein